MTLVLAQTGAPTAVVNRSVGGFIDGAANHRLLFGIGGPDALVAARFTQERPTLSELDRAGSCLGGGRRSVTPQDLDVIVDQLADRNVQGLSLIGGNGTMAFLRAIQDRATARNYALRTVGIPKTIDNDLDGIDHSPGFASAARYLASSVADMVRDHTAMQSVEQVRIVETMGRDTGWLGLAASYHRHDPGYSADLILIPELDFSLETVISKIDDILARNGRAFVIVSEGVAPELTTSPVKSNNHTQLIQGGISRLLASEVGRKLGVSARGEVMGTAQRSSSALVSSRDRREAEKLGRVAANWLLDPLAPTGVMVSLDSAGDATPVALAEVAGRVRHVPERWQKQCPSELQEFYEWIDPLIELS